MKELTFFGKGWGAVYEIPFLRFRNDSGYSSELSYLNLIHKIGFFAIIYFKFYLWTFYQIFKTKISNNLDQINTSLFSLGLITYLFLSLGNPILFAPAFVFMHVLSLHILNKSLIHYHNE